MDIVNKVVGGSHGSRIEWLDTVRGLAFLMVIYSHFTAFEESVMMRYFSPVFLSSFFFVSGYLTKSGDPFTKVFEQRTRTLFVPQFIFGLLLVLSTTLFTFKEEHSPLLNRLVGLVFPYKGYDNILWFIIALWAYSIVFYWILRFSKSIRKLLLISCLLVIVNWLYKDVFNGPFLPYYLSYFGYGCLYMSLGYSFRKYETNSDKIIKPWMTIFAMIAYIVTITYTQKTYSFAGGGKCVIDSLLIAILGLFIMVYLSKISLNCGGKFLLFIGANSLLYFCFHGKVLSFLDFIAKKFLYGNGILEHSVTTDICVRILLTIIDALIVIIPVIVVNKWMPWLTGKGYKLWKA